MSRFPRHHILISLTGALLGAACGILVSWTFRPHNQIVIAWTADGGIAGLILGAVAGISALLKGAAVRDVTPEIFDWLHPRILGASRGALLGLVPGLALAATLGLMMLLPTLHNGYGRPAANYCVYRRQLSSPAWVV